MIEFVKQLQKHNAELMEEIKTLKEEREAILRILDSDKAAIVIEKIRNMKPPKTLVEALEGNPAFPCFVNGLYGTFKNTEIKTDTKAVSMTVKFNLLNIMYQKTQSVDNKFTKEEKCFIETLAKQAIRDVTDEHYKDLLKIAQKSL